LEEVDGAAEVVGLLVPVTVAPDGSLERIALGLKLGLKLAEGAAEVDGARLGFALVEGAGEIEGLSLAFARPTINSGGFAVSRERNSFPST
jgi:hypothetical protein